MSEPKFRQLDANDMEQLLDVRSASYSMISDRELAAKVLGTRFPYSLGAFAGGRLLSVSYMLPLAGYLGGRRVIFGGLSGVATSPESRRSGLVAQILRRWYENLRERNIGWSGEHPFEPSFYARYGYQTVLNGHAVTVSPSELSRSAGVSPSVEAEAEPVKVDSVARLSEIHQRFAQRFSFSLARDDGVKDHWPSLMQRPWETAPRLAFLLEDAYAILTTEDDPAQPGRRTMEVQDFAYTSPAGRRRLFALLGKFDGQVSRLRIHLPPGDRVALDRVAYSSAQAAEFQVRIVDLASALGVLRWPQEASLRLRVVDADCEWNNGTFDIEVGPHGAAVARSSGGEPDASLDIATLAALVTGAATPETLLADGRAEGSVGKLRPLGRALEGHPVFKADGDHF